MRHTAPCGGRSPEKNHEQGRLRHLAQPGALSDEASCLVYAKAELGQGRKLRADLDHIYATVDELASSGDSPGQHHASAHPDSSSRPNTNRSRSSSWPCSPREGRAHGRRKFHRTSSTASAHSAKATCFHRRDHLRTASPIASANICKRGAQGDHNRTTIPSFTRSSTRSLHR